MYSQDAMGVCPMALNVFTRFLLPAQQSRRSGRARHLGLASDCQGPPGCVNRFKLEIAATLLSFLFFFFPSFSFLRCILRLDRIKSYIYLLPRTTSMTANAQHQAQLVVRRKKKKSYQQVIIACTPLRRGDLRRLLPGRLRLLVHQPDVQYLYSVQVPKGCVGTWSGSMPR